jgi:MarR family transcriptional regulator, multiple antibiotic resistance protein MarR
MPSSVTSFYKPENYSPQGSLVYLMLRNKSIYQRLADIQLSDLGITAAQMSVLMMVAHNEESTISSISNLLGINAAATVRMIHKLESMELIKKLQSDADKRVFHLSLTQTGSKLAKRIPERLCGLLNRSLAGFTLAEFDQFKDFLLRIEKNNALQLKDLS